MIVLVCGGRNYNKRETIFGELNRLSAELGRIVAIIHGCASGADTLAAEWQEFRIKRERAEWKKGMELPRLWMVGCHAAWDDLETPPVAIRYRGDGAAYNAAAGGVRNAFMLTFLPDACLAFPGGRGTADMCARAEAAGVPVRRV